jgi:hypothetical protein
MGPQNGPLRNPRRSRKKRHHGAKTTKSDPQKDHREAPFGGQKEASPQSDFGVEKTSQVGIMASKEDNAFRRSLVKKRDKFAREAKSLRKQGMKSDARIMTSMSHDSAKKIRAFDRYETQTRRLARKGISNLQRLLALKRIYK